MKQRLTPQEKKIRDYSNQRVNVFGEGNKSSRKAIRKRKRWVNRAFRKAGKNVSQSGSQDIDSIDVDIADLKRHGWRKIPDELLIQRINHKWSGSSRSKVKPHVGDLRNEAIKRVKKSKHRYTYL